ncbi:MAG: ATP-dependent Clp protease ATP-binding subunit ClpX [bacterium]
MKKKDNLCSLCGNVIKEYAYIAEDGSKVCLECIKEKAILVAENRKKKRVNVLKPKEIKEELDKFIIGQDYAKKVVSVGVYNHYKRVFADDVSGIDKSNILLFGPTGVGKTLIARCLASILNVPFSISDATSLTEAGYVGEDVENILLRLIISADYDIEKAQIGICYIDEIDKIGSKTAGNPSITRDVSGEGVQQALLKILEGTVANIPPQGGRKHPEQKYLQMDTKNILFIAGGAFNYLDETIKSRINKSQIGFKQTQHKEDDKKILKKAEQRDFVSYGMIPEFVGRFPVIAPLFELNLEEMKRILYEPENSLVNQYKKLLSLDGIELDFADSALDYIAKEAVERKTGARGLRSVIETFMLDLMFELPSSKSGRKIMITDKDIKEFEKGI